MTERLHVPRATIATALDALYAAAEAMVTTGQELGRSLPELAAIRRRLEERLPPNVATVEALDELDRARALIVRLQKQLVVAKTAAREGWRQVRRCDPDLTPDRPPSRDDMAACTEASEAFARANAHLSGERKSIR